MILVIEDDKQILNMAQENNLVADNALIGLEILKRNPNIKKVFCDFHGISKDGIGAHEVFDYCYVHNIEFVLTSSDRDAAHLYQSKGAKTVDKLGMLKEIC